MSWVLLVALVVVLSLSLFAALSRRAELTRMEHHVRERELARQQGSHKARLQYPFVDLSRCLGCATCVAVCPEEGVLEIVHGQAMVVHGARCVGISACARECPVGAITVTVEGLSERKDIPAIGEGLEAVGSPGLFLAGEVTGQALVATAVRHGAAVGAEVVRRTQAAGASDPEILDLCIVGCGPAGMACSLEAKREGLNFVTLDQEDGLGGTVAKYPRRKLVMTQPMDLPIHGRLKRTSFLKEELMELWEQLATEHELPIKTNEVFAGLERSDDGSYVVRTEKRSYAARHVVLALGRRGSPRKLGVPGEDLPKVAYSLIDAGSYQGRRILVVGGGDSAIEGALALASQPGNKVTLSYRSQAFTRAKLRNQERVKEFAQEGKIEVLFQTEIKSITPDSVAIASRTGEWSDTYDLPNDEVFVMAGGIPPFKLLEAAGISFDPKDREDPGPIVEEGTGLLRALTGGLLLALAALAWAAWNGGYYGLSPKARPEHTAHDLLRPSNGIGLAMGIVAAVLIVVNLAYLLRRNPRIPLQAGSLQGWMTSHVVTGILAFLCAMLHGAMAPGDTLGGHAFWSLGALLATGAIGRYIYAFVPRAANGRELDVDEVKTRLARISEEWDSGQVKFRERAHDEIRALLARTQWTKSVPRRLARLLLNRRDLRRALGRIEGLGRSEQMADDQLQDTLRLARRAHRAAVSAAHQEELRGLLATWRYLHRWVALLMVLLVIAHVVIAWRYAAPFFGGGE